jgi:O-antigen ligase
LISTVGGVDFGTQREVITGARSAYGLSYESNVLAGLMATWVFIALTSQDPATGRVRALLIAFGTAAMLLAYTRAAVLGLVAGVAVWAAFGGWLARRRLVRVAAVAAALALAAVAVVPTVTTPLYDKLSSASPFSSSTGAVRVTSWSLALGDIGGGRWLAGLGVNSYGQRHLDFTKPGTNTPGYLGNLPLQIVYETGVVGVLLVAAALASLRPMLGPRRGRALGLLVLYTCTAIATSPFWFGSSWILIALAVLAELERSDTAGA